MRIALIGFGKMGREIDAVAREQGETVAHIFDSKHPLKPEMLADVDVCIEFTKPTAVLTHIYAAIEAKQDIVVGTTGWYDHVPDLQAKARESGILYSPNFSLGMNIFQRIVTRAAELMQNASDYDPFIHEEHHRHKADSPSGTAMRLAGILLEKIDRKKAVQTQPPSGKIESNALHVRVDHGHAHGGIRFRSRQHRTSPYREESPRVRFGRTCRCPLVTRSPWRVHDGRCGFVVLEKIYD